MENYRVSASTTTNARTDELEQTEASPFVLNIDSLSDNIQTFLESEILLINIPSKNIDSFVALLKAIEISKIKKVLFISSSSVYKDNNKTVSETDQDSFSQSPLLLIEKLFTSSTQFETTIIRFGGLIGYNRNPANFFKKGRQIKNPDAPVNLIHRDDCINIIAQIITKGIWGETFSACVDSHPSKRNFYTRAALQAGKETPEFESNSSNNFKIVSNKKLKAQLDYTFIHPDLMKIKFD